MIRLRGRFNSGLVARAATALAMLAASPELVSAEDGRGQPAVTVPLPVARDAAPTAAGPKPAGQAGLVPAAATPLPPVRPPAPSAETAKTAATPGAAAPGSAASETATAAPPLPPVRPKTPSSAVADAFSSFGPQRPARVAQQPAGTQVAYASPREPLPLDAPPPLGTLLSGPAASDMDCRALAAEGTAVFTAKPAFGRASGCGASAPIELKAVRRKDGGLVTFQPAAIMRCSMARAATAYVREDLAPAAAAGGMTLDQIDVAASYDCRSRNRIRGAKLSEHGRANALDIRGFGFSNGRDHGVYSRSLPARMRAILMPAACNRFNTVLGPGSDGYHEDHLHMDLMERRRSGYKTCRWRGA